MRASRGFTMIELLTVMTVLAIMVAIAVPSYRNFIASQRVRAASYEISTSLLLARSEAIKRNAQVTIAPSGGTDWTSGWSITTTQTIGGIATTVTLQNQAAIQGISITQNPSAANIVFQGTGRPTATAKTYWAIAGTNSTRCVVLDTAGVASTSSSGSCP